MKAGNSKSKKQDRNKKPEWMANAPTDGILTKTVDGKAYHFCSFHKRWGFHKEADYYVRMRQTQTSPADSSISPSTTSRSTPSNGSLSTTDSTSGHLTMAAAINAVLVEDDNNSSYAVFPSLLAIAPSNSVSSPTKKPVTTFDSDSFAILLVDNAASRCMTNNIKHFVGNARPFSKKVTGLGAGTVTLEGKSVGLGRTIEARSIQRTFQTP